LILSEIRSAVNQIREHGSTARQQMHIKENLRKQKNSDDWTRNDGQYIPYPATWLNGQRWEDEVRRQFRAL